MKSSKTLASQPVPTSSANRERSGSSSNAVDVTQSFGNSVPKRHPSARASLALGQTPNEASLGPPSEWVMMQVLYHDRYQDKT